MPTVFATTNDGFISIGDDFTFSTVRDATVGTVDGTSSSGSLTAGIKAVSSKGSLAFTSARSFFEFDFTGISNVGSATLKLKNTISISGVVRIVKMSTSVGAGLSAGDYDAITGFSSGNPMTGVVTDYVDAPVTMGANSVTSITLNSTAIADINANNKFNIVVVGNTHDYLNSAPSSVGGNSVGIAFTEAPGTTEDPQIEYTVASSGRSAEAGGTFSREQLRSKQDVTTEITADTDFEFKFENNLKNQVYFNIEGVNNKDIFNTASLRTTDSDSGSNVLNFISESQHVSFILAENSTSSFFMSSSVAIPGNSFKVVATNPQVISLGDIEASGSTFGINMELLS